MNPFRYLLLILLIVPFAEIYLLLEVGSIIGAMPTIFLVVSTAFLGAYLLKQQGLATFQRFQQSMAQGVIPAYEIIEGPIILLGGVLLLTPGFITDVLGFICLIPALRRALAQFLIENSDIVTSVMFNQGKHQAGQSQVLEGEFHREKD
ncbi:FxsA family protein [Methylocucumis oryzae]|uniref:Exlusion protein FxsA n=1 Tax=Methylocucumis oryzae TaxID=1632867 RepID=A0A0F3IJ12_9GAMM|nr:FxsA family protein [Methylocucumis oryzae]KJV05524.1 exlusion protein FxsA [Methylocucumis oryzae]